MIDPLDLKRIRESVGDQPRLARSFYHPTCPICKRLKSTNTGQRGGTLRCNTCRAKTRVLSYKTPEKVRQDGQRAWTNIVAMVAVLAGEEAAARMPEFDEALPHLFNMHQGEK